nr:MAG TPA: hypothetical protein [Caudoviricetes sp.]
MACATTITEGFTPFIIADLKPVSGVSWLRQITTRYASGYDFNL